MKYIKSLIKYAVLFFFGGLVYYLIEILWRGYSHWTMIILGGLCFVVVGLINNILPWNMVIELQALIGAVLITSLEFVVGLIVNVNLGWDIWDYSNVPFNFLGQICLPFSLLWYVLSIIVIFTDDYIRYIFFNEKKPVYKSIFI
nr:MAG TPA: Putative ABC-transporter type IV [Caudoviricetes sp.]